MMSLLTVEEVAERLKLSERTIRRYAENGLLPGVTKIGKNLRFEETVLEAFIASGGTAAEAFAQQKA